MAYLHCRIPICPKDGYSKDWGSGSGSESESESVQ